MYRSSRPRPEPEEAEPTTTVPCHSFRLPSIDLQRRVAPPSAVKERERQRAPSLPFSRGTQCNIVVAAAATCDGPKIVENARAPAIRLKGGSERGRAADLRGPRPRPTCDCLSWASLHRPFLWSRWPSLKSQPCRTQHIKCELGLNLEEVT